MRPLLIAAALAGLILTVMGAMGGHAPPTPPSASHMLSEDVWVFDERAWQSATVFGFAHVLAAAMAASLPLGGRLKLWSGWAFLLGVLLFAVSLMTRQLLMARYVPVAEAEAVTSRYGAFLISVPVGGVCFMLGWVLLAIAAWRAPKA